MIYKTKLTANDEKEYKLTLDTRLLQRNYDDEDYAYWLEDLGDGRWAEVNIWKENGDFTSEGVAYIYEDYGTLVDDGEPFCKCDIIMEDEMTAGRKTT